MNDFRVGATVRYFNRHYGELGRGTITSINPITGQVTATLTGQQIGKNASRFFDRNGDGIAGASFGSKIVLVSPFSVGQKARYMGVSGRPILGGIGTITEIDEAKGRITLKFDTGTTRTFDLQGRGIGHKHGAGAGSDEGSYLQLVTDAPHKRSGYLLISAVRQDVRFFLDHQEASDNFHDADGSYVLCTCEQQADSEGAEFRTTNIGGPIEPLPKTPSKPVVTHSWVRTKGKLNPKEWVWISSQPADPRPAYTVDLHLIFEDGVLKTAEVL